MVSNTKPTTYLYTILRMVNVAITLPLCIQSLPEIYFSCYMLLPNAQTHEQ